MKLKELVEIKRGSSPRPIQEYITTKGYKWLKISDFKWGDKYVYETKEYIKESGLKGTRQLRKGTLILTNSATPGIPIFLGDDMCLHDGFLYFKNLNSKILNMEYLYCWFLINRDQIVNQANGSVFKNLKKEIVENLDIVLPSIHIQNKITCIYNAITNKMIENTAINDNLHEIAENYFKKLSKEGRETKLEDLIFEIQSGSREKGGAVTNGIPSIGAEKIEKLGTYNFESEKYISEEYFKKLKNGIVHSGDVLLYKDGAYAGKVSMAMNGFPHKNCAINEHVFILRTENNWANCYLYFLLYDSKIREQVQAMASSKAAQPGLNQKEVKSVKIRQPSREKIVEFEEKAKVIVGKIIQNSMENKNLGQLRDTLLPKLMNGEIDLDKIKI